MKMMVSTSPRLGGNVASVTGDETNRAFGEKVKVVTGNSYCFEPQGSYN